jgi:hypothetical protein
MKLLDARCVLSADRRGSSWPVLAETDDGTWFTKLRGAAQGTGALVAEVIVAELAESLGLRAPARSLVRFGDDIESIDKNDELADLLRASRGVNLGFAYLEGATNFSPESDPARVRQEDAVAIVWLDGLTANPDRTARNSNLLWWRGALYLIDHGAALGFQYSLPDVDPSAARRPYTIREPHLLREQAGDLGAHDEALAARLPREAVERAVAAVPDEFLTQLAGDELGARRAAYVDYLLRRLAAPRPFLEPTIVAAPNEMGRRGRPSWLVGRR